jgi:hypothetical protein
MADGQPERLGSLEVDDQLELYCLLNRQIIGAGAVEDSAGIDVGHAIGVGEIGHLYGDPIGALGGSQCLSSPSDARKWCEQPGEYRCRPEA